MAKDRCRSCPKSAECNYDDRETSHLKSDTLCWCCANVVPSKDGERYCHLHDGGEMIEGLKADKHEKDGHVSYNVKDCPLFARG